MLNIVAIFARIAFTVAPSCAIIFSSAMIASFQAPFAEAVAATALRTVLMYDTACGAVKVCPATVKTAVGQYMGIPATSARY